MILRRFLDIKQTTDFILKDHEYQIEYPNDVKTEDKTNKSRYDFAFGKSSDCSANPRRYRNDSQDKADNPTKTKVIGFFACHTEKLSL